MPTRIPATQLARNLGDVLGRIRYRGESFLVERNGALVARIGPVSAPQAAPIGELFEAWRTVEADPDFAGDLERVSASDARAELSWPWNAPGIRPAR